MKKNNRKKILVLGGSGFLGSHVCDELKKKEHQVTIYDLKKSKWVKKHKVIIGTILNLKKLEKIIKNKDVVYNFAGVSDLDEAVKNPISTIKLNILANMQLLKICSYYKVSRYIYSSSIYAGSNQGGFYSASKRSAEDYIKEFCTLSGLDYTILRYGTVYGPRATDTNSVKNIIKYANKNKKILYPGNKKSKREYIHVKDAAKASVEILNKKFINKCLMLTGNKSIRIINFLKILASTLNIKGKIKFKNKERYGHYISKPKDYRIIKAEKLRFKNLHSFKEEIINFKKWVY